MVHLIWDSRLNNKTFRMIPATFRSILNAFATVHQRCRLHEWNLTRFAGCASVIYGNRKVLRSRRSASPSKLSGLGLCYSIYGLCKVRMLTLKTPRKLASKNVVCLCRLLNILANFSNLFYAHRQTGWTQIRLLLKEQSDLGPHCLQKWLLNSQADDKADDNCCTWRIIFR